MKKVLIFVFVAVAAIAVSCSKDKSEDGIPVNPEDTLVHVTDVILEDSVLVLEEGAVTVLYVTVLPEDADDRTVHWSSSDSEIVSVDDDGTVTAVSAGEAQVTVTANDGGKTASCRITVTELKVAVTGVTLDEEYLELYETGSVRLIATVYPEDATDRSVHWLSSDSEIVSVDDDGTVTAVSAGEAQVTVTTHDGGKTASCSFRVNPLGSWAYSNIVWIEDSSCPDGGYLTFAETPSVNDEIPALSQGVLFPWGSLVAISPAPLTDGDTEYTAGKYPDGLIVFDPVGNWNYGWTKESMPYIGDLAEPFFDGDIESDDFASYNGNIGYDEKTGKGDICRYISDKGWVEGAWRLPTAKEIDNLVAETPAGAVVYGNFSEVSVPAGDSRYAYGLYQIPSGRSLGLSGDVIIPASGGRGYMGYGSWCDGVVEKTGTTGAVWSASNYNGTRTYVLEVSVSGSDRNYGERLRALPVRCIRDE